MTGLVHIYRWPGDSESTILRKVQSKLPNVISVHTEYCFNVEVKCSQELPEDQKERLMWLFAETFEAHNTRDGSSFLTTSSANEAIVEVGPRLAFTTAWSSNCSSMCEACGVTNVGRIERSRRYKITSSSSLTTQDISLFASIIHDRMTECVYASPLNSFDMGSVPEPVKTIPLLSGGRAVLEEINRTRGLGFDDWDLDHYMNMFVEELKRDPTDVEIFDLAQSNSEHSRHWFFSGRIIIDGEEKKDSLFQMVKSTLPKQSNSVIAFHDNSSAIYGYEVDRLAPQDPLTSSPLQKTHQLWHPILTAETHNFPCGVAPFPGAETGTGGRLRDVQATGRGAVPIAGLNGYCVGNLNIPHHPLPWEKSAAPERYPSNLAAPVDIMVEASNGASDYGNKFGEPVVLGFARTFGMRLPLDADGESERIEWIKPIMFTAGVGMMDGRHSVKGGPEEGMIVCKIGGPAYRIGLGGGAASSRVGGEGDVALDFDAVQRGDAEMENRMNRVIKGCVEMGEKNPLVSIHDQGAGGNGNVLKEIVDPLGALIALRSIPCGDPTLSVQEIWGAEYQENNAFLVRKEDLPIVLALGERENCPVSPVGEVTNTGRVIVKDSDGSTPFDMPLSLVLGSKVPRKTFQFTTPHRPLSPFVLPLGETFQSCLERVLQLLDVGSKRFLTNKVDRSVGGLVAQQPCVGPLHTPLSDVAVLSLSDQDVKGMAAAIGERPVIGLLSPAAQARMTVVEALSSVSFAQISSLSDVKASGNWMWAAKMEGEGARMYDCCQALCEALKALGPAIDGGKDSLSMAAKVPWAGGGEVVKAPGEVVLTVYAPCPDVRNTLTPDLKKGGESRLVYLDLGKGRARLGGSALGRVYNQLGDTPPDFTDFPLFKRVFDGVQECMKRGIAEAGHDRSDGGLVVCLLEMAFGGNVGWEVHLPPAPAGLTPLEVCFAEEGGIVLEVLSIHLQEVMQIFAEREVSAVDIGGTVKAAEVSLYVGEECLLRDQMTRLRDVWESTSFALERMQTDNDCVVQEQEGLKKRTGAPFYTSYTPSPTPSAVLTRSPQSKPRIAVIRQEGTNGDRELANAFIAGGVEAWDVHMGDLLRGKIGLEGFRGVVFAGGFSYADVLDSAKGWAGGVLLNEKLKSQFKAFRERTDVFSLGICNGCQLMALLGWVPLNPGEVSSEEQPRFVHNRSGRFESRFAAVKVLPSPSVLLRGMEGSVLGVWVAHGEGKCYFPSPKVKEIVDREGLAPVRYVDDAGEPTEVYPLNPNGSPGGIAGLCSGDGRHLCLMPHPERGYLPWQLPYLSAREKRGEGEEGLRAAPWLKFFQNARGFLESDLES